MRTGYRNIDLGLLPVAVGTLSGGMLLLAFGQEAAAGLSWAAGALATTAALLVAMVRSLRRKEAGVDILALLALGLALALGEFLAAAVLALMIESGKALEGYAQARSQREMSALLSRAPAVCQPVRGWRMAYRLAGGRPTGRSPPGPAGRSGAGRRRTGGTSAAGRVCADRRIAANPI